MTRYLWVPHPDGGYDALCGLLSEQPGIRVLTRQTGRQPIDGRRQGEADRFGPTDVLTVMGHGVAADTGRIGWAGERRVDAADGASAGNRTIRKSHRELAHMIVGRLGPKAYRFPVQIELLNCWDADRLLFASCFAAKLASTLGAAGVGGRVVAYTGALPPSVTDGRSLRDLFEVTGARRVFPIPG